ncbi:unnamed protein product [Adineta steineri]|uniref:Cadherin domain-containing protein n=4 Tax=Adineta steineri TaxID=433720 RepID=A0A819U8M4_9BILA|nr:unnamed protein product [Adineta steineri]CAF3828286.1 unnamed protein product [Adineta steineri]CAF4087842.1 unnamed protein product [Adineta steineri]
MISLRIFFIFFISSLYSTHSLHFLPPIIIDPINYHKSDLILYDFRYEFHPTYPYRCILQTESKYFYLNPSCQLLTRTSLKQFCSFNSTLKLEIVFPQNTTIYEIKIQSNQTNCNKNSLCQFEKNPYRIKLKENEIYKNFLHIKTLSPCLSTNYLLSSTNTKKNFDYFSLNSTTGYLSLLQSLDYESITTWKLVIQAHNIHHIPFYTYVIIDVDDINDCPPLLSWNFPLQTIQIINDTDSFHIEISVHESKVEQKGIIIANLIASDLDSQLKFDLKINSSGFLPFNIDGPYGDSTYVLLTNMKLDREYKDQYILNLIISDYGKPILTSYYKLKINIIDNNDNSPEFDRDIYYVDIQENNFINTTLIQIFANDSDINENGRITYELNNEKNNYVWIDHQTGIIRTTIQFDYEEIKNFSFNVTAMDHPKIGQQFKTTAMVFVNIIDQNDNIPKFPQSTYEFSISENNAPQSYIGQVTAIDPDGPVLIYTLDNPSDEISSQFSLSSSDGKLYAITSLDREQSDQYIFYIIASDGYHISSRIKILIKILDLNDETPRFIFPNEVNDTLIIDLGYWNINDYICEIETQDNDQIQTHTLLLIYRFDQLKNYDYLIKHRNILQFDTIKFFLDQQGRLFFNSTNNSILQEGVYYLAFKIVDGHDYYDEKILKLIVVKDYERVQTIIKRYDYLGLHLNNRFAYLQYQKSKTNRTSILEQPNKFFLLIVCSMLILILLGITVIFISLIRRKSLKEKELLKTQPSISSNSQQQSNSSTINLLKPSNKGNLHVTNCFDYNDSTLVMLNKDLITSSSLLNDNCCLLDTINEHDIYDTQKNNKTYSSWMLPNSNHPESHYSQRNIDSSTFHTFNHLSMRSPSTLSNELCSPKRHTSMQPSSEYTVAVVSSSSTNNCSHTPVSSDDGFCGSSDTSDPSLPNGNHHLLSTYRQPYIVVKDGIINKNQHPISLTNATDTTRRVRFNLQCEEQRTILPNHISDHTLRQFEQIYMTRDNILEKQSINSTVV